MEAPPVFAALGLQREEETLYRTLLELPNSSFDDLADQTSWSTPQLHRWLRALTGRGLVTHIPGQPIRYLPASPDIAVEVLALQREEEIQRARVEATRLTAAFREAGARRGAAVVGMQVLQGREAIVQGYFQLVKAARHEIMLIDMAPYAIDGNLMDAAHALFASFLARNVRIRVLYEPEALDLPGRMERIRALVAAGQEARVLAGLLHKLVIVDHGAGLVPIDTFPFEHGHLLLQRSSLLQGLERLFESEWVRAMPLWPPGGGGRAGVPTKLSDDDEHLLALLAAGHTDKSIALKLDVGVRTVERRIARLMSRLGTQTRFQAGMRAVELGLLGTGGARL